MRTIFIIITKKQLYSGFAAIIFIVVLLLIYANLIFNKQPEDLQPVIKNQRDYLILVYIDEKKLYLFEHDNLIKQYTVATGTPNTPSPIGTWKIISKDTWGEGFGGRWLGFNVPWGKYGIHGTLEEHLIGSDSSAGCIRMFNKDVKELYDIVPHGTPVIIKNGSFGPFGTGFRNLLPGDRGADVMEVQKKLKALGYFKGYTSGIYEDDLKYALHKFQKANKLKVKDTITRVDYHAMGFREFE